MPFSPENLLFALALLILTAGFVAWPLVERRARRTARHAATPAASRAALEQRRVEIVAEIRDLDFDHALDKVAAPDYQATRAQLVAEGVEVLKALDLDKEAAGAPGVPNLEEAIEREIAVRRKARPARRKGQRRPATPGVRACPECGRAARPDETFCPRCGARLPADQVTA